MGNPSGVKGLRVQVAEKEIPKLFHLNISPRKGNEPTKGQRKTLTSGIQTHKLLVLITVALSAELQGQSESRPWVLEILVHAIEASN